MVPLVIRPARFPVRAVTLALALLFGLITVVHADFDDEFSNYTDGDLQGQQDWAAQGFDHGGQNYVNLSDRAEVRIDPDRKSKVIVWYAGHGGVDQTRIVKRFPATSGQKVEISFAFKPGDTEAGKFSFEQTEGGARFLLRFIRGTVEYISPQSPVPIDTKAYLSIDNWNEFNLQLNFETHSIRFFLNGKLVGEYPLASGLTGLDQVNFFGGGTNFESALSDLKINSVSGFSKNPAGSGGSL